MSGSRWLYLLTSKHGKHILKSVRNLNYFYYALTGLFTSKMDFVLLTIIFAIVLFIYIHVHHNLKVSNDLELLELDSPSKDRIEEVCSVKQPVLIKGLYTPLNDTLKLNSLVNEYSAFDVNLKDNKVPLSNMIQHLTTSNVPSDSNQVFLEETDTKGHIRNNDLIWKPPLVAKCDYDLIFGVQQTSVLLQYSIANRTCLTTYDGPIRVKLTCPRSNKYLHQECDYLNNRYLSPVNVWEPQEQYKTDVLRTKFIDVVLAPGQTLVIPPYWWYTFTFTTSSTVSCFKYSTYMGLVSTLNYSAMALFQRMNSYRKSNTREHVAAAATDNQIQSNESKSDATQSVLPSNTEAPVNSQSDLKSDVAETNQDTSTSQSDKQSESAEEFVEPTSAVEQLKPEDSEVNDSFLEYTVDESVGTVTKDSLDAIDKPILVTGSIDT